MANPLIQPLPTPLPAHRQLPAGRGAGAHLPSIAVALMTTCAALVLGLAAPPAAAAT